MLDDNEHLSIKQAFTEEEVNILIQMGCDLRTSCWEIGRFVNAKMKQIHNQGKVVCEMSLYEYVSELIGEISARTVRQYANIAEFYPPEIEEIYEALAFQHFIVARQISHSFKISARDVLDLAIEMMHKRNGRRPTAELLEQAAIKMWGNGAEVPPAPEDVPDELTRWLPSPADQLNQVNYGISFQEDGSPVLQISASGAAQPGVIQEASGTVSEPRAILVTVLRTVILPLVRKLDRKMSAELQPTFEDILDKLTNS